MNGWIHAHYSGHDLPSPLWGFAIISLLLKLPSNKDTDLQEQRSPWRNNVNQFGDMLEQIATWYWFRTHRQFWTTLTMSPGKGEVEIYSNPIQGPRCSEMEVLSWRRMVHALESQAPDFQLSFSPWHLKQAINLFGLQYLPLKNNDNIRPHFLGCRENPMR